MGAPEITKTFVIVICSQDGLGVIMSIIFIWIHLTNLRLNTGPSASLIPANWMRVGDCVDLGLIGALTRECYVVVAVGA